MEWGTERGGSKWSGSGSDPGVVKQTDGRERLLRETYASTGESRGTGKEDGYGVGSDTERVVRVNEFGLWTRNRDDERGGCRGGESTWGPGTGGRVTVGTCRGRGRVYTILETCGSTGVREGKSTLF